MLLLTTYRPGYRPPWLEQSYATQIALAPLGPDDSRQVMRSVPRQTALAPGVEQQLLAKAQGNPLFLEELAHTIAEQGSASPGLRVPETIHAVLAARMDRLPALEKSLLQEAAVIGVDVPFPLLQAVGDRPEAALLQGLRRLQTAGFLYETRVLPTRAYTFKHVLTQEVAYQALVPSVRQQVHQRIAQVLVEQFPTAVDTQPELGAHHYTEAGMMVQALAYWQRAGQCAVERSGHREAIAHLTKGLEVLHTLPDSHERTQHELALHIALGASLTAIAGYGAPEVQRVYTRARALCQEVGDTPQLPSVLFGLWRFYVQRGQLQTALELGEQCLTLAQRMHDPVYLLRGHNTLGVTLFYLGEMRRARTHLEQGESFYDPQQLRSPTFVMDPLAARRAYAALVLWCLGYPDQALWKSQEALSLAQELAHPHSLAFILVIDAWLHQLRREEHSVLERAQAAVTLATAQGFALWAAVGTFWRGWILAAQGQGDEGIADMRRGFAAWQATGADVWQPHMLALLAEVQGKVGRTDEGFQALAEALTLVNNTGERFYEAEMHRLQGELLLQRTIQEARQTISEGQQAEACFHQALAIARRQEAKSLELRAAMSLSRLWQQQGKHAEAHELLAPVYGWFTEGFDTADLQEAKALLVELGG
jgi:predicted ATPase